ncbi:methyltransferase domain-containing protein [Magnetospira thiophila]
MDKTPFSQDRCFGDLARSGRTGLAPYALAVVVIVFSLPLLNVVLIYLLGALYESWSWNLSSAWSAFMLAIDGRVRDSVYTAFMLTSVALALPGLLAAVRILHRRPLRSLFTGRRRFNWSLFGLSLGIGLLVNGGMWALLVWSGEGTATLSWDPDVWLFALLLLPLPLLAQVTAEEALFRGYVYQTVGLFFAHPWLRVLLPALLFTAIHLPNPEVAGGGLSVVADYLVLSLYLGILVHRTNGLEASIGLHAAINLTVALGISYPDATIPGAAPWVLESVNWVLAAPLSLLGAVLHYGLLLTLRPLPSPPAPAARPKKEALPMLIKRNADALCDALALDGKQVLDVGCGVGDIARRMAGQGARVIGLEPNPVQLAHARAVPPVGGETYLSAGGESLPFEDGRFDLVVFFNSLHHLPPAAMAPALGEAARVLRPGGHVYISEPVAEGAFFRLMQPIDDETDVRALALAAIEAAEAQGLTEITRDTYLHPMRYPDYETFAQRIGNIDPARSEAFARLDAQMRAAFEEYGERRADGIWFHQPTRTHLLLKKC